MKAPGVEAWPEAALHVGAEREELLVAVEVARGLAGVVEGVTLELLGRERVRDPDLLAEHAPRFVDSDGAELELRIQERARFAEQEELKRDELPVLGHERARQILGVERPALDVDRVEREERPRERDAALRHRRELQIVAGAPLVRRERPRRGGEGEIIGFQARRAGQGERQDEEELALLRQEPLEIHVRRRLLRRLRRGGDAEAHGTRGERHQLLATNDRLHVRDALLVRHANRVAHQLIALELADHGERAGVGEPLLTRHLARQGLHFALGHGERAAGFLREGAGLGVDPLLRQAVRIHLRRLPEIDATPRQDLGLHELVVLGELPGQRGERRLEPGDPRLREHLGDASPVGRRVREVLLDLRAHRADQPGCPSASRVRLAASFATGSPIPRAPRTCGGARARAAGAPPAADR